MMTAEHIEILRTAALRLMGDKCTMCGETDINTLEIHHIKQSNLGPGRGQDRRAWEGLKLAMMGTGCIMCQPCHIAYHRANHTHHDGGFSDV